MSFDEAKALILEEGLGQKGLVNALRRGDEPSAARVEGVIAAVRAVYEGTRKDNRLDRDLACALFNLAGHTRADVDSWRARGALYRKDLIADELPRLAAAVESVFNGLWVESD